MLFKLLLVFHFIIIASGCASSMAAYDVTGKQSLMHVLAFSPVKVTALPEITFTVHTGKEDVRLIGRDPNDKSQGRLEVKKNGEWGTVCDDIFDGNNNAANVVCRMLGFFNGGIPVDSSVFGVGTGNVFFDDVKCNGNEPKLENCFHVYGRGDCLDSEHVGVICNSNFTTQIPSTTTLSPATVQPGNCSVTSSVVRLIGPKNSPSVGFVEIKYNNTWYSVCDDFWDLQDAQVICRMLCYDTNLTTTGLDRNLMYIKDHVSTSILLDDVGCNGTETNVLSCPNNFGEHNCQKGEYASVQCTPPTLPSVSKAPEAVLQCDNERFTMSFSRSYDTFLEPKHLTIFNQYTGQCRLQKSLTDDYVVMKIPFSDCGTDITGNSSHLMYVNTIRYNYTTVSNGIVRKNTYIIELVCEFPRNQTNTGNFQPQSQFVTMAAPGQFYTVMLLFADYTYQVPLNPTALYLGDLVVIVVGLNATHSKLNLVTRTCIATPTADRNDSKKHTLFENNCIMDDTVRINPINNTAMSLSFHAFKFVGNDNVYIHCMSVVCSLDEKNSMCDRSCNTNSGRKKRSIADGDSAVIYTISPRLSFNGPSSSEAPIQREWSTLTENYSTKTTLTTTKPTPRSSSKRQFSPTPKSTTQILSTRTTTTQSNNVVLTTRRDAVLSTTMAPKWSTSSKATSTTAPIKTLSTTKNYETPELTSKSFSEDTTPISSSSKRPPTTAASTEKWKTLIVRASPSTTQVNTVTDRGTTPTNIQQDPYKKNMNEKRYPGNNYNELKYFDFTSGSCRSSTFSFLPLLLLFSSTLVSGITAL